MLREYVISEAMYHLGILTSRSLAVVLTGEFVFRETRLKGAILTRVASSHLRIGTFQYLSVKKDIEVLKQLADYAINWHYPKLFESKNPYLALLKKVMKQQINPTILAAASLLILISILLLTTIELLRRYSKNK